MGKVAAPAAYFLCRAGLAGGMPSLFLPLPRRTNPVARIQRVLGAKAPRRPRPARRSGIEPGPAAPRHAVAAAAPGAEAAVNQRRYSA